MANLLSVLLVEDHPAWGDLLSIKLHACDSLHLCARVNSIQDALDIVQQQPMQAVAILTRALQLLSHLK